MRLSPASLFFFFNDTATTEIYTLSLHERSSDLQNRSSPTSCTRDDSASVSFPQPDQSSSASPSSRSEEHTSELQSRSDLVCRLLLEKKKLIGTGRREDRGVGGGGPVAVAQIDAG